MNKMIGKYRIVKALGEGNMGEVYLVIDEQIDKKYAMKIAYKTEDHIYEEMLKKEFEYMKNISNRKIPYVVDFGETDNLYYMTMECLEGISLEKYIEKNAPIDIEESLYIVRQIAEILGYLHNLKPGIIFRDLKPSNLIIDNQKNVSLLDFGAGLECYYKAESALMMGTYGYAAPEVIESKNIGTFSDIYALGAILYYMLTGLNPALPPYKIQDIETVSVTVPLDICRLVKRMTNENYHDRFQNTNEVIEEIDKTKIRRPVRKMYVAYVIYYFVLFISAAFTGFSLWICYKNVMPKYEYIVMSIIMYISCVIYKKTIDRYYDRKYFIKKRELNIVYTKKRTAGLFALVSGIFMMTGCVGNMETGRIDASIVNDYGQNVLVRDGAVYNACEEVNFKVNLEKDCDYQIYIVKKGNDLERDELKIFNVRY